MGRIKPGKVNSQRRRTRERAIGAYTPVYQDTSPHGMTAVRTSLAELSAKMRKSRVRLASDPNRSTGG